jgi:tripartite-type tricarboxylate transporter receptor subunit TctC
MQIRKTLTWLLSAAALAAVAAAPATAQDTYPSKPIRIIAPFGAGGGGDVSLRMLGSHLSRALGQPVVVDNKPGANGVIGVQEALRAPADGYTLFYGSTTTLAANASLMKKLPYDPIKDFSAITVVSSIPFMLVVNPATQATSVAQLVALAKSSATPLTFASSNQTALVAGSVFARLSDVKLTHVPYKASPAGIADLIGGQVSMMFVDVATGLPMVKAGRLRALGVTTAARSTLMPDTPTIAETLRGYEVIGWTAMVAAAGTPAAVTTRVHSEIEKILAQPEVRADFEKVGFEPRTTTPQQTAAYILSERDKWAQYVKDAGIAAE